MRQLNSVSLFGVGLLAGAIVAVQRVINASLGQRVGNVGSSLVVTVGSIVVLTAIVLLFPASAKFESLPGLSEWHLYLGGVLGVAILAAPIFLVPRIGTTSTVVAIVFGQLIMALFVDHYGLLSSPQIGATWPRIMGVVLVAAGAVLVSR